MKHQNSFLQELREQKILIFILIIWLIGTCHHFFLKPKSLSKSSTNTKTTSNDIVEKLIKNLNSNNTNWKSIKQLGKIGDPRAVPPLIRYIQKTKYDENGMMFAVEALALLKDIRAIEPLTVLYQNPNPRFRALAVKTLGQFDDPRTLKIVTTALNDENSKVRYTAEQTMRKMPQKLRQKSAEYLTRDLKSLNVKIRLNTIRRLERIQNPDTVNALAAALHDPLYEIRDLAQCILIRIGKPSLPAVLKILNDSDKNVRKEAVIILGCIKDPSTIQALEIATKDSDHSVANAAVDALSKIKGFNMLPVLLDQLKNTKNFDSSIVSALVRCGDPARIELEKLLSNKNEAIRFNAIVTLNEMKSPKSHNALLFATKDSSIRIVIKAMDTLVRIKDKNSAKTILFLLNHPNKKIRQNAARTIVALEDKKTMRILAESMQNKEIRRWSLQALWKIADKSTTPLLMQMLYNKDNEIRESAVKLLGKLKEKSAVRILTPLLKENNSHLSREVIKTLGLIQSPQAIMSIYYYAAQKQKANDLLSVWRAIKALKKIGTPVITLMIPQLNHYNEENRNVAAAILSEFQDKQASKALIKEWNHKNLAVIVGGYSFFIKQKIPNGEDLFIEVLNKKGNSRMAEAFLNSGNIKLKKAAKKWADKHGYLISHSIKFISK